MTATKINLESAYEETVEWVAEEMHDPNTPSPFSMTAAF